MRLMRPLSGSSMPIGKISISVAFFDEKTGNWRADTPRSPDFKVGLPGKALKYVT